MSDFKQAALMASELLASFAMVYAMAAFIAWNADLSELGKADRFLMVWVSLGIFAMMQIRNIK